MQTITSKIEFITGHFGECDVSRDGTNVAVKCPSCGKENKKKLSICLETWRYHCWVCGMKGKNLYKPIRDFRGADYAREYSKLYNLNNEDDESAPEIIRVKLPKDYMMIAPNLKCKDPDFRSVLKYLRSRGVTDEKLWQHKIGTCITGGYWNRRVIFPSFDEKQELNYYVSRAIDEKTKPKYVNAKVKKRDVIFDEIRIDWDKELIIVEGVFDMIKCNHNVTCLLGSDMSIKHSIFQKIIQNQTAVALALDEDVKDKTYKIANLLFTYGIEVRIINTEGVEDVGEMSVEEFNQRLVEADNYNGDSKISYLIDSIKSGSIF